MNAVLSLLCLALALQCVDISANMTKLHGPSMFAIKAKIYEVLYEQASSIAFDETSSYWSGPKNSQFLGFSSVNTR